jgi:hypothetical protein
MTSSRARFLSLLLITEHGASTVSVCRNIASFASVYSSHLSREARSVGESFHCRTESIWRTMKRLRCSPRDTENHSLTRETPLPTSIRSNSGAWRRKTSYSSSVA